MGYAMPIVCKELYIPVWNVEQPISLEEYKDKTGLDLKKYIRLDNDSKNIEFAFPKYTKVYVVDADKIDYISIVAVGIPNFLEQTAYESGVTDGHSSYGFHDVKGSYGFGFTLSISNNKDFIIDNIKIEKEEL